MTPGIAGRLISSWFVDELLASTLAGRLGEQTRPEAFRQFGRWWARASRTLGPASSLRAMFDTAGAPLVELLGFSAGAFSIFEQPPVLVATLAGSAHPVALFVSTWQDDLAATWRATRARVETTARWALCFNGTTVRLLDAQRPYATRFLEIDLEAAAHDDRTFAAFWALLHARALAGPIDGAIDSSARHGAGVCRSLREGVLEALQEFLHALLAASGRRRKHPPPLDEAFEQALTIVYRILFLLFAEARGLVPTWQPIYRNAYTIEMLRDIVEGTGSARGLWESLQAIARVAASGCQVGDLVVTAFNGRLFSPSRTPLGERLALDDQRVRCAVRALSSRPAATGRERIAYRDLDVEQLGAVYERVLDYVPAASEPARGTSNRPPVPAVRLDRIGTKRKSTGSFYTPRSITDYLVRRTLAPLVHDRSPDQILALRIVDPAMGSGAFLVAACRYLARHYEAALVNHGHCSAGDIGPGDRGQFRRSVAQRCLYGVDANPTAVQLARLSIWLATLAADRPLTFLDHHLAVGDSLIGASLDDLARQPPGGHRRPAALPLFETDPAFEAIREALPIRRELAATPDDSADIVRQKERTLERLADAHGRLAQSKLAADLWCAAWFLPAKEIPRPALFAELTAAAFDRPTTLAPDALRTWLDRLRTIAAQHRFFHWTLEFPEVFFSQDGERLASLGFDAIVGNPPWDVLRADEGADRRTMVHHQMRFVRGSGLYRGRAQGHVNLYQLFVERALMLARDGGRIGLVLPSGLFTDIGSAPLRSLLLSRCGIDSVIGMDNRDGIFPIHRSTRFLLLTATSCATTGTIACRFHETDPSQLDAIAARAGAADRAAYPIALTPGTIARVGGRSGTIPLPHLPIDLAIMEKVIASFPSLAEADGWQARFGRELNATEDRPHFRESGAGLPVVEGKQISPFAVDLTRSAHRIPREVARKLPHLRTTFGRERLAYRDVAAPGNRLTLIAAVLPADCVTTHTVFCLKTPLDADAQAFLCGLFNSLVLNYLVRQRVTTHVTTAIVHELPVARPSRESDAFRQIAQLAGKLRVAPGATQILVALQARIFRLYELTLEEVEHVLSTFPLLDAGYRQAIREAFVAGG